MPFEQIPYTNFHGTNQDWMIQQIKQMIADWASYRENLDAAWADYQENINNWRQALDASFTKLHTYVHDYFDNLDVQEEINNKLDQMVEDGTLDQLLLPYFNAYKAEINAIISTQNNNITVLQSEMNAFLESHPATTGEKDAELVDIRVGVDGHIYQTAGDAVRDQLEDIITATEIVTVKGKNLLDPEDLTITGQYYTTGTGDHSDDAQFKSYAHTVEVEPGTSYILSINGNSSSAVFATIVQLDINNNKVAGGYNQPPLVTTEANTKYLLISLYASYENLKPQLEKGTTATAYEQYFTPYQKSEFRDDIDNLIDSIDNVKDVANELRGKKICSFGDSIASGDNGDRNAVTWLTKLADHFEMIPYNRGIGTTCVTNETSQGVARTGYAYVNSEGDAGEIRGLYNSERDFPNFPNSISPWMCDSDRANTIPLDTDIVVIIAGTNDIGTTTVEQFTAAYKEMLNHIITRVPNAIIYPCTLPFQKTYDTGSVNAQNIYNSYRTAIKEVSNLYGLKCIDLRSEMGVNAQNYTSYMSDSTHYFTAKGKAAMAQCIGEHLKTICYM